MITRIEQALRDHKPWRLSGEHTPDRQAGVMVLLTDAEVPELILTKRNSHLSSHGGEVAFPGGKRDPIDTDLLATALRETHEEIGLLPDCVRPIGSLSDVLSKHQLKVMPWVGVVDSSQTLIANPAEIESIFTVPLTFFMEPGRVRFDHFVDLSGQSRYSPSWKHEHYVIWGLTAWVLAELLNTAFDANIKTGLRPERTSHGSTQKST